MTNEEARLLKEMRDNQKLYFKTRNRLYLDKSKKLEQEVDSLIERYLPPLAPNRNNTQSSIEWSR